MPAVANIVINDGAATPVATTFSPIGKDEKGVFWYEQTTPVPANQIAAWKIGQKQTRSLSSPNVLDRSSKLTYTIHVPTAETMSVSDGGFVPSPRLAYKEVARIELDLAERSTKQERKHLRVLSMNLLAAAVAIANADDLQPTY